MRALSLCASRLFQVQQVNVTRASGVSASTVENVVPWHDVQGDPRRSQVLPAQRILPSQALVGDVEVHST